MARLGVPGLRVVGVAAEDWDAEQLTAHAREDIEAAGESIDEDVFARFMQRLSYVSGDFKAPDTYQRLAEQLRSSRMRVFSNDVYITTRSALAVARTIAAASLGRASSGPSARNAACV